MTGRRNVDEITRSRRQTRQRCWLPLRSTMRRLDSSRGAHSLHDTQVSRTSLLPHSAQKYKCMYVSLFTYVYNVALLHSNVVFGLRGPFVKPSAHSSAWNCALVVFSHK